MKSPKWSLHPKIYEINTWVWLDSLADQYNYTINLKNVPEEVFEKNIIYFDVVWLMGIWTRSPKSREMALNNQELKGQFQKIKPNFTGNDIGSSPYAIKDYQIEPHLGGEKGLKKFSKQLADLGILLILDFVPNHVALDHPWVFNHPEYFIQGNKSDLEKYPKEFIKINEYIYAHGRDPNFPPWSDTIQVNAFSAAYRKQVLETLANIAGLCDGVRCDMAMLLISNIFLNIWKGKCGPSLPKEFWKEIIPQIKSNDPDFKFIAEVYWDREWELQKQGFDFCYDKKLYDRLLYDSPESVRGHLWADLEYQNKLFRFVENHDEERCYTVFGKQKSIAAAVIALTLPGARMIYEGQTDGYSLKSPIQFTHHLNQPQIPEVTDFYSKFLPVWNIWLVNGGKWRLLNIQALNQNDNSFIAFIWDYPDHEFLTIVNYSNQGHFGKISFEKLFESNKKGLNWEIIEQINSNMTISTSNGMHDEELQITALPWGVGIYIIKLV